MTTDQAPTLMGVSWSFTGMATLLGILRLFCRIRYASKLWWDDFWMLISLVFSWAMTITWTVYTAKGGASYEQLASNQYAQVHELECISRVWCVVALVTGKIAIAALIKRMQDHCTWRTVILWVVPTVVSIWCIGHITMMFVQCDHVAMLWDQTIDGNCWDPMTVVMNAQAMSAYLGFCNLLLAGLVVQMIWKSQMPLRWKVSVYCLASIGIIAFACSVVRVVILPGGVEDNADLVRHFALLFIFISIEVNIVITASCFPAFLPLFSQSHRHPAHEFRSDDRKLSFLHWTKPSTHPPSSKRLWGSSSEVGCDLPEQRRSEKFSSRSNHSSTWHEEDSRTKDADLRGSIRVTRDVDVTSYSTETLDEHFEKRALSY